MIPHPITPPSLLTNQNPWPSDATAMPVQLPVAPLSDVQPGISFALP
jgi:hypothetical protein